MNTKLPKVYYGYKKLLNIWKRQPESQDRTVMIECLEQSMQEIVDRYMEEFETEMYKEIA